MTSRQPPHLRIPKIDVEVRRRPAFGGTEENKMVEVFIANAVYPQGDHYHAEAETPARALAQLGAFLVGRLEK